MERETTNISETLETKLEALREEIAQAEQEVDEHRDRLNELKADLEASATASEAARKALSKAVKASDEVQKDIAEWVRLQQVASRESELRPYSRFRTERRDSKTIFRTIRHLPSLQG